MMGPRQILILLALLDAAWMDWREKQINDRDSLLIFFCSDSFAAILYGLSLSGLLWQIAKKTQRLGQGDVWLLGSLSAVLSTLHFAQVCMLSTILMHMLHISRDEIPVAPYLFISLLALFTIEIYVA